MSMAFAVQKRAWHTQHDQRGRFQSVAELGMTLRYAPENQDLPH